MYTNYHLQLKATLNHAMGRSGLSNGIDAPSTSGPLSNNVGTPQGLPNHKDVPEACRSMQFWSHFKRYLEQGDSAGIPLLQKKLTTNGLDTKEVITFSGVPHNVIWDEESTCNLECLSEACMYYLGMPFMGINSLREQAIVAMTKNSSELTA